MKRRTRALAVIGCAVAAIGAIHCASAPSAPPPALAGDAVVQVGDGRYLMGTILDITLVGEEPDELRAHLEWAFERVAELETVASRHLENSELTRFNAAAGQPPSPEYSADFEALLTRSIEAGRDTEGVFDVTVGPLIGLWIDAVAHGTWPSAAALDAARALVGFESIVVTDDARLGLVGGGRSVDFGGIGKGHALDVVRAGLVERGVTRGLLDFGGSSVWAMGRAPGGGPWLLEVDAREPGADPRVLAMVDRALSVSSSLGESSTIAGREIGHVIDPRTGETVTAQRTAVVVGTSATDAEVWSTALLVFAPCDGVVRVSALAESEAWVRFEDGDTRATPGFAPYWASDGALGMGSERDTGVPLGTPGSKDTLVHGARSARCD